MKSPDLLHKSNLWFILPLWICIYFSSNLTEFVEEWREEGEKHQIITDNDVGFYPAVDPGGLPSFHFSHNCPNHLANMILYRSATKVLSKTFRNNKNKVGQGESPASRPGFSCHLYLSCKMNRDIHRVWPLITFLISLLVWNSKPPVPCVGGFNALGQWIPFPQTPKSWAQSW